MTSGLKVIFAGSGAFGIPTLRALVERHQVVSVFTQPDKPAGRGKKLTPTPIADTAESLDLPVTKTANFNHEPLPEADVLVVIAFGQRISQQQTTAARLGAINLHASLLPKYRGAAPIHHALLNGETVVGNSVIRLAEKMDAGAVLGQRELTVRPSETTAELHDRLADDGPALVLGVLEALAAGTATETEQDHASATLASKLSRDDAQIDWTRSAPMVASQINALSPWPGCRVSVDGNTMTLLRASAIAGDAIPGVIDDDGLIGTGDGRLRIIELQSSGKKPMTLKDYRNGRPWKTGTKVLHVS